MRGHRLVKVGVFFFCLCLGLLMVNLFYILVTSKCIANEKVQVKLGFANGQLFHYISVVKQINLKDMAKRIKSEVEKQYIARMWNTRKEYLEHKAEYECVWGSYMDGELMRKAKARYDNLRKSLQNERNRALRMAA